MTDSENIIHIVNKDLKKPLIRVAPGYLPEMADEAEAAIIKAKRHIYQRGASLLRPVNTLLDASHGRKALIAVLHEVTKTHLRDVMARPARWEKFSVRKNKDVKADPPDDVAAIILDRFGEWSFPPIVGIISTPTLRPDGTVLSEQGHDQDTRFYLADPPELPPIPEKPTKDDALVALGDLNDLLEEFPFVGGVNGPAHAVALSALITPVVRGNFICAPMHVARAPAPASGKSYLFDVAAAIAFGQPCPMMAAGRDETEMEKRLGAALLNAQAMICVDNVNGELGGDCLCMAVERPVVMIRILGKSELVRIEPRGTTFFATGNNITIVGDMIRRAIVTTLDPDIEQPELRQFKGNPVDTVLADRGRYIAAALTICRAYIAASRPDIAPKLASFEGWSDTVRSALIWLGCGDPVKTMEISRSEDPELNALRAITRAWADTFGAGLANQRSVADVLKATEEREIHYRGDGDAHDGYETDYRHPALREAILAGVPARGRLNARIFGRWLARSQGRIAGGLKFMRSTDARGPVARWWVENVGEIKEPAVHAP